jgi:hypothetical protein
VSRLALGAAVPVLAACSHRGAERSATRTEHIPVAGAALFKLSVGAGFLRVEGSSGTDEIAITGVAHAVSPAQLDAIQLVTHRIADTIFVSFSIPRRSLIQIRRSPSVDVVVRLPSSLALDVVDGAGDAIFRNVGPFRLTHGDGNLDVDSVAGSVDVTDGEGDMVLANVNGDVRIVDGAGSIHLSTIKGSVTIPSDGSGEIQAIDVSGDLSVGAKESGEVFARGVGGNLAVTANGNGSIEYHDVRGHVTIPAR